MRIHPTNQRKWSPRHETFEQGIENLYDLVNDDTDSVVDDYNSTTVGIQEIIAEAVQKKRHLRAIGGEWSFTKISATDGILLNTKLLNLTIKITPVECSGQLPKNRR